MPHVVLVPGFTQTATSWDGVREIVDSANTVTAVEVPVRETFAETAHAIGRRSQRGVYVGYSMGGRLCLRLAIDRPDLVRALVLVSASPGMVDPVERATRVASDEALARTIEREGVARFLEQWLAQPLFATVPRNAPGLQERNALAPEYLAHCLRVLGAGTMPPMWDELRTLTMPVALVTGKLDVKYQALARKMFERTPGDVTHVSLDSGHAVPLEQPAVLGGFVNAFAAQHS